MLTDALKLNWFIEMLFLKNNHYLDTNTLYLFLLDNEKN
ncbi:phage-related protein [Listeria monocytogenes FSL F2-208]|nr:phage-related protein [Listeria monocytogenes FSL F2-208]